MPYKTTLTILLALSLHFFHPTSASAQLSSPVKWSFTSKKINATTYELHITAILTAGWRVYAQEPGKGPLRTTIKLSKNPLAIPSGSPKEVGKLIKSFDADFNSETRYYENTVNFIQKVILKAKSVTTVTGTVEYMVRDSKEVMPPQQAGFSIKIGN